MDVKREWDGPVRKSEDYEPPAVVVLGTIAELTAGAANPGGDIVFSTSDRRLKTDLRRVQPADVLQGLVALPLR